MELDRRVGFPLTVTVGTPAMTFAVMRESTVGAREDCVASQDPSMKRMEFVLTNERLETEPSTVNEEVKF